MEDFVRTRGSENIENAEKEYVVNTYKKHKSVKSTKIHKNDENIVNKYRLQDDIESENEMQDDNNTKTHTNHKRKHEKTKEELEMKRFRYDVMKFGMTGFSKQNVHQAKIALAVSLGAKPPKNKRKNYKKLIEERKAIKAQQNKKDKFASGFNPSQLLMKFKKQIKPNTNKKTNKKSKKSGILDVYGKVTKNKNKVKKK